MDEPKSSAADAILATGPVVAAGRNVVRALGLLHEDWIVPHELESTIKDLAARIKDLDEAIGKAVTR